MSKEKLLINDSKSNNGEVMSNKQIEELTNELVFTSNYGTYNAVANYLVNKGYRKIPDNIGEFSDGYHTFNELYHHRAVLFSVICNMMPERAWKSKLHDTGDMFDGMFIVGIETEQGQATYHYDIEPYWDMFKVKELEKAPKWDGHTPSDAIERIGSISGKQSEVIHCRDCGVPHNKWTGCPKLNGLVTHPDFYCACAEPKMKGGAE